MIGPVLVIPACEPGRGGGHIYRSLNLVQDIRAAGGEARLFLASGFRGLSAVSRELLISSTDLLKKNWSLIILDRFRCPPEELEHWSALAPTLGIDEGLSRQGCDFLIDLLPGLPAREMANIISPSLLALPKRRRSSFYYSGQGPYKVMISFGAEDHAQFSVDAAQALQDTGASLTVVLGPLRRNNERDREFLEKAGISVIVGEKTGVLQIRENMADYDLMVGHFGISSFEALYARVPVLLLNPGFYHEKLTRHAGLVSVGAGRRGLAELSRFFLDKRNPDRIAKQSEAAARRWGLEGRRENFAALLLAASPKVHNTCPLCGKISTPRGSNRLLGRFPGRTYRLCSCGTVYMDRLDKPPVEYNRDYFFSGYREQYGRTYLEDFPWLRKYGEKRLTHIQSLLRKKNSSASPRLLDIGCAYGPFLEVARNGGFEVIGLDPVEEAVDHVKNKLGILAVQGCFPELCMAKDTPLTGKFDAITLWYVIEHFEEPGMALRIINGLLKPGGILAFSTPSFQGISRKKSVPSFLKHSPGDHWTIWDPFRCGAILAGYGFRIRKRKITGHHPERFPLIGTRLKPGPVQQFFTMVSILFGLGDTFEVYAVKVQDIP
jgi:2-polyprenyl-3-methyl-5-hydroxy-6-metoxy-1,4-benzoquinol methylase/spore coat polysaccharide biosynthesis predicted glycosyltransferase SpsG